jgi:hypothetical protein
MTAASSSCLPISASMPTSLAAAARRAWHGEPPAETYFGGMRTIESQKSSTERTIVMNSSSPTGLTM